MKKKREATNVMLMDLAKRVIRSLKLLDPSDFCFGGAINETGVKVLFLVALNDVKDHYKIKEIHTEYRAGEEKKFMDIVFEMKDRRIFQFELKIRNLGAAARGYYKERGYRYQRVKMKDVLSDFSKNHTKLPYLFYGEDGKETEMTVSDWMETHHEQVEEYHEILRRKFSDREIISYLVCNIGHKIWFTEVSRHLPESRLGLDLLGLKV